MEERAGIAVMLDESYKLPVSFDWGQRLWSSELPHSSSMGLCLHVPHLLYNAADCQQA